ncbi:predicted protein [Postia placenta Mad-698-R]|nr:predicted protein [Postia placenta Mad-698-R]
MLKMTKNTSDRVASAVGCSHLAAQMVTVSHRRIVALPRSRCIKVIASLRGNRHNRTAGVIRSCLLADVGRRPKLAGKLAKTTSYCCRGLLWEHRGVDGQPAGQLRAPRDSGETQATVKRERRRRRASERPASMCASTASRAHIEGRVVSPSDQIVFLSRDAATAGRQLAVCVPRAARASDEREYVHLPLSPAAAAGRQLTFCLHGAWVMQNTARAQRAHAQYVAALSTLISGSAWLTAGAAALPCQEDTSVRPAACATGAARHGMRLLGLCSRTTGGAGTRPPPTVEGDWELRAKLEPEPELNIPGAEPVERHKTERARARACSTVSVRPLKMPGGTRLVESVQVQADPAHAASKCCVIASLCGNRRTAGIIRGCSLAKMTSVGMRHPVVSRSPVLARAAAAVYITNQELKIYSFVCSGAGRLCPASLGPPGRRLLSERLAAARTMLPSATATFGLATQGLRSRRRCAPSDLGFRGLVLPRSTSAKTSDPYEQRPRNMSAKARAQRLSAARRGVRGREPGRGICALGQSRWARGGDGTYLGVEWRALEAACAALVHFARWRAPLVEDVKDKDAATRRQYDQWKRNTMAGRGLRKQMDKRIPARSRAHVPLRHAIVTVTQLAAPQGAYSDRAWLTFATEE